MAQMIVTLEWDDSLGQRWYHKEALMNRLSLDGGPGETLRVVSVVHSPITAKERAEEEFQQLSCRMDKLGSLSYKDFMALDYEARQLLENQYDAMSQYRKAILARINLWTDETS